MIPTIGTFVMRLDGANPRPVGLQHFVESVIEDEPVCHCGRRLMKRPARRPNSFFVSTEPTNVCSGCKAKVPVA